MIPVLPGYIYQYLPETSGTQWVYVREIKGPYVWLSGVENTFADIKIRKRVLREVVNPDNYKSNGILLSDGCVLGLAGPGFSTGVLMYNNEDEAV